MKVVLTGGGTGGHITPLLAVARELKRHNPDIHIVYIGERSGKFKHLTNDNPDINETRAIFAGKFRRYHGESWLKRLLDVRTNLLNLRDLFYFAFGTLQAVVMIRRLKPDVMLLKGGFVGVPAGLAGAFWRIPFVTHDSDSVPGLANRIVAKWAKYHATGAPAQYYPYPKNKIKHVGVLVSSNHKPVSKQQQDSFKDELGYQGKTVLLVTGASSGAVELNKAMRQLAPGLLDDYPKLQIVHQVGKGKAGVYDGYSHERLDVQEFLYPFYAYSGASDCIVTRGSATALAEFGVQGRACIVVPSPWLTGGHQLKNAAELEARGAAVVVQESTLTSAPHKLDSTIRDLLSHTEKRKKFGHRLQDVTIPDATQKLTMLLLEVAKR